MRYPDLWSRLIANTREPENEQACWEWKGKRNDYGLFNLHVPHFKAIRTYFAHVAVFVIMEGKPRTADEFHFMYREFKASGLTLDHMCENTLCVNIDHLDPVTALVNYERYLQRKAAAKVKAFLMRQAA